MASHLKKVDHISYACAQGTIEKWAWFHIEVEGGTLINRIDDVRPDDPGSSMKIWCIDYGEFGVALIEGIDRAEKSQVTKFVDKHGDHAVQHVAFDTFDLEKFIEHFQSLGGHARGEMLVRNDGFGMLKQLFARGYEEGDAGEASFPEYCQRPSRDESAEEVPEYCQRPSRDESAEEVAITFAEETGKGFYDQVQDAIDEGDEAPFFDFSQMPLSWEVPEATPLEGFIA